MGSSADSSVPVIRLAQSCVLIRMEGASVEAIGLGEHVSYSVHLATSTPLATLSPLTTPHVSVQTIFTAAAWSLDVSVRLVRIVALKI